MSTFLLSFVVMLACVVALALGVLLGRAPLRGSCGGLNNCDCANPCARYGKRGQSSLRHSLSPRAEERGKEDLGQ